MASIHAKAIAFAKSSVSVKKQNSLKRINNEPKSSLYFFYAKDQVKKTPNIREMRAFRTLAKMASMQTL